MMTDDAFEQLLKYAQKGELYSNGRMGDQRLIFVEKSHVSALRGLVPSLCMPILSGGMVAVQGLQSHLSEAQLGGLHQALDEAGKRRSGWSMET